MEVHAFEVFVVTLAQDFYVLADEALKFPVFGGRINEQLAKEVAVGALEGGHFRFGATCENANEFFLGQPGVAIPRLIRVEFDPFPRGCGGAQGNADQQGCCERDEAHVDFSFNHWTHTGSEGFKLSGSAAGLADGGEQGVKIGLGGEGVDERDAEKETGGEAGLYEIEVAGLQE